ncbi:MAG: ATP-binding protein [Silvanigrellaceae bacterium]|nr:ATP-binding protein [Silvanigrellaceae bacterium]
MNTPHQKIYIAYAWPVDEKYEKENWIQSYLQVFQEALKLAGFSTVRLDITSNRMGANINKFMESIEASSYVLLFGSESLQIKHRRGTHALCTELNLIMQKRERDGKRNLCRVFPILLSGSHRDVFPIDYERYITVKDWRKGSCGYLEHFQKLFIELLGQSPERFLPLLQKYWKKAEEETFDLAQASPNLCWYANKRKEIESLKSKKNFNELSQLSLIPSGYTPLVSLKNIHPDFVGRENYFGELINTCLKKRDNILSVTILWGEGGVGKSEIAIAFGNKYKNKFSLVYWIECDSQASYDQSYRDLAKMLQLVYEDHDSSEAIRKKVHQYLEQLSSPWLIIYDNAEKFLELPQRGNGAIIITSRNLAAWHPFKTINVLPFTEEEALGYFQKVLKDQEIKQIRKDLVYELDYFPLALSQALHYIEKTPGMTEETYLRLLRDNKLAVLNDMPMDSRYPYGFLASWRITLEKLAREDPNAFDWLEFCSYLYPDGIPSWWIKDWLFIRKELSDMSEVNLELMKNKILSSLNNYSLIRYDKNTNKMSIHRLRQESIRNDLQNPLRVEKEVISLLAYNIQEFESRDDFEYQVGENLNLSEWALHCSWWFNHYADNNFNQNIAASFTISSIHSFLMN